MAMDIMQRKKRKNSLVAVAIEGVGHGDMDQQGELLRTQIAYDVLLKRSKTGAAFAITFYSISELIRLMNSSAALYPCCFKYQLFAAASINPATSRPGWSWISIEGILTPI